MRTPTPDADLYEWWANAVTGNESPRHESDPQCGFYKRRMVAKGPWVPVKVICQREIDIHGRLISDEQIVAVYPTGKEVPAANIWTHLTPIGYLEFKALVASSSDDRMKATHARVDLTTKPMEP